MNCGNGRLVAYGLACSLVMVMAAAAPAAGAEVIEGGLYQQTDGVREFDNGGASALVVAGRYELSGDAQLLVSGMMSIRGFLHTDTAEFVQTGGAVHLMMPSEGQDHWATLQIGRTDATSVEEWFSGTGNYIISGGSLTAGRIIVGGSNLSILSIADPIAEVTVRQIYMTGGRIEAVPGSSIQLLPSPLASNKFPNFTNIPGFGSGNNGMVNLTFKIDGDASGNLMWFHMTGHDFGANEIGYENNGAIGAFEIGLTESVMLMLSDERMFVSRAAIYVDTIILGEGSTLDVAGLKLYYRNFTNLGGEVLLNGGTFQQVPEPASMAMLGLGAVALLRRRRK